MKLTKELYNNLTLALTNENTQSKRFTQAKLLYSDHIITMDHKYQYISIETDDCEFEFEFGDDLDINPEINEHDVDYDDNNDPTSKLIEDFKYMGIITTDINGKYVPTQNFKKQPDTSTRLFYPTPISGGSIKEITANNIATKLITFTKNTDPYEWADLAGSNPDAFELECLVEINQQIKTSATAIKRSLDQFIKNYDLTQEQRLDYIHITQSLTDFIKTYQNGVSKEKLEQDMQHLDTLCSVDESTVDADLSL